MAKFIKVHDIEGNTPTLINTNSICYVTYDVQTKKTMIRIEKGIQCIVHETVDKIYEMIQAD